MLILVAACALATQQPHQASFPFPPGPDPDQFGIKLAIDGDRALVGMMRGEDAAIWSYRRDGLGWTPEAPFPDTIFRSGNEGAFVDSALVLDGDLAIFGDTAHELVFDGAAWVVTDVLPDTCLVDVDLDHGVAVGSIQRPQRVEVAIVERAAGGWFLAQSFWAPELSPYGPMSIEGDVAVIAHPAWFDCSHLAWDGRFGVIEQDSVTGGWMHSQTVELLDCRETLLGSAVLVKEGLIHAVRHDPARVEIYGRDAAGVWSTVGAIDPPGVTLALPSPLGSFMGTVGAAPVIPLEGRTAMLSYREGTALAGPVRLGEFRDDGSGVWQLLSSSAIQNSVPTNCNLPNAGAAPAAPLVYTIDEPGSGPVGMLLPARNAAGCVRDLLAFDPVISAPTCVPKDTSLGTPARLDLVGSYRRAAAHTGFVASGLIPGTTCLPLFSRTPGFTAHPGGSEGDLCLGDPAVRLTQYVGAADAGGVLQFQVDLAAVASGVAVGLPVHFQLWFRDVTASGFPSSNFTNGAVMRAW